MAAVQAQYEHLLRGGTLPGKGKNTSWDHMKPKPPKRKPKQPRAPPIPQLVEEDEEEGQGEGGKVEDGNGRGNFEERQAEKALRGVEVEEVEHEDL